MKNAINFLNEYYLLKSAYADYARAMSRRRPDSVLPESNFVMHGLFHANIRSTEDGVLLYQDYGAFKIPSHFAPKTLRSGVNMIKELKNEGDWILLIPEDLMIMARKVGYQILPFKVPMEFRGEVIDKYICLSSPKQQKILMELFLKLHLSGAKIEAIEEELNSMAIPVWKWNSHKYFEAAGLLYKGQVGKVKDLLGIYKKDKHGFIVYPSNKRINWEMLMHQPETRRRRRRV